jgi:hypothetical protein
MNPHILGKCVFAGEIESVSANGVTTKATTGVYIATCDGMIELECSKLLLESLEQNIVYRQVKAFLQADENGHLFRKNGRFVAKEIQLTL